MLVKSPLPSPSAPSLWEYRAGRWDASVDDSHGKEFSQYVHERHIRRRILEFLSLSAIQVTKQKHEDMSSSVLLNFVFFVV